MTELNRLKLELNAIKAALTSDSTHKDFEAELIQAIAADADEIVALRKQRAELVAILERIANLGPRGGAASALAKSALDTMRLLDKPQRSIGAVTPAADL